MSAPILTTKLYIPPPRPNLVNRARLITKLNAGLHGKLTLISAPAGFGKTTLVSSWILDFDVASPEKASIQHQKSKIKNGVAWLSLDEGDRDPQRFLSYLIAALQTVIPTIGHNILKLLQSPPPPSTETLLATLLNELAVLPGQYILVLDDYHLLDAEEALGVVDEALAFLLEHLPPHLHLVITTREDPNLPLARLRARGQLSEVRASDLRFTEAEAADFLNSVMGLTLSPTEVAALESRTEGWIAGLQLAALSMRGREDVAGFIRAFAGDNHYIVDYLVEEVLQRQPEVVHHFLLQTSILDRLSGPLCAAVTRQDNGREMLETLERGNLFVIPLDDRRHWYRYHHLFADVLYAHLLEAQPEQLSTLHQRASEWYEQNGQPADAIRHALTAKDFERAARLIESLWRVMDINLESATWLGWVKALPDEFIRTRPVLSVGYAWALLNGGELEAVEVRLQDAERRLEGTAEGVAPEMVVTDEEAFRSLAATIAGARAFHAQARGDTPGSILYAQRTLDLFPEEDHRGRAIPAAILGLAYWASGELEAAHQALTEAMSRFQWSGNLVAAISPAYGLADIRITQGRLREAVHTYEQSLQFALSHTDGIQTNGLSGPILRGTGDLYLGLSELSHEQGDRTAAAQYLQQSEELGEQAALPDWPHRLRIVQARIKMSHGDLDDALDLLGEAERLYYRTPVPDARPIAAWKARVWIRQGRLAEALGWARERGLSLEDDLSYLREFEHITLARVFIAQHQRKRGKGSIQDVLRFLERLLEAAEAGGRMGSAIEILVLQAFAHATQGDSPQALTALEHALRLAEPEGYVCLFVDEGPAMRFLIFDFRFLHPEGTRQQPTTEQNSKLTVYADNLLAAFGNAQANMGEFLIAEQSKIQNPKSKINNLVEPLSDRELEVLRLLGTDLTGPEIARKLMVSLNTMRTHTKNIYSKLGVNSRRAAVRRAADLALL